MSYWECYLLRLPLKEAIPVPVRAIKVPAFQSNEPDKAKLKVNDWS